MRILLLAPHPFYQDRGTPIAVDLVLKVLAQRGERVDVITYHEGRNVKYNNVSIFRLPSLPFVNGLRPGFSWKKVACDLLMFFMTVKYVSRNKYQIIHAVEEAVFIALIMKWIFKVPYIYDMDSSLPQQLVEKYSWLRIVAFILNFLENIAIQNAKVVIPVCEALANVAREYKQNNVNVIHDVPLLAGSQNVCQIHLKEELCVTGMIIMYVGNLEEYQGIDLLLESFRLVLKANDKVALVIVGGERGDIRKYWDKCEELGIWQRVHFLGTKPLEELAVYLTNADILVSPRIKGKNTPMKLYSYLLSGKPVLATNIESHTQLLDNEVAYLSEPYPQHFAVGMLRLLGDQPLRSSLGMSGKKLVEENFSYEQFSKKLNQLLNNLRGSQDQE